MATGREVSRWLGDAEEDLRVAEALLKLGHYAAFCFHSQQAAEKAVKAALLAHQVEARGRSVLVLLRLLSREAGVDIEGLEEDARLLDRHYAPPRYPNLHPGVSLPAHKLYGGVMPSLVYAPRGAC